MKQLILYILLCFCFLETRAQNIVLCQVDSIMTNKINVKWYFKPLTSEEGFTIYRKSTEETVWKKLNVEGVKFKSKNVPAEEFQKDKELSSYITMASKPENLKDLVLLSTIIKSFKSKALCMHLGIWYEDTTAIIGKSYQYKVERLLRGQESEFSISNTILAGKYIPIEAPKNISYETGKRKVSFKWLPETDRYLGVNVYRQRNDSGNFVKLTKDPIILSKTKNEKGEEIYGDEFFADQKLDPSSKYKYVFEALDFFGNPSQRSNPIAVVLKDLEAPKAPGAFHQTVKGKFVSLSWNKNKEADLNGYNIYRTVNNDTDFVKINFKLIPANDSLFIDTVKRYSSYMYAVSAVDKSGNESAINPYFVEVNDVEAPKVPTNITISKDSNAVYLCWDENKEEDLMGYFIYRTINKDNEDTYVKITPDPIQSNYYKDDLKCNAKNNFLYKIVAVDKNLNRSPYSKFVSARLIDVTEPQAPFMTELGLNEKSQVVLSWLPNAEPDLKGYNIYRKDLIDSTSHFIQINAKIIHRQVSKYIDRTTEEGVIYKYQMRAVDSSGNSSANSNLLIYKPKCLKNKDEIKISSFYAEYDAKHKRVELEWHVKTEASLKAKILFRKKSGENSLRPYSYLSKENKSTDMQIEKGVSYFYQLRVYNEAGDVFKSELQQIIIE